MTVPGMAYDNIAVSDMAVSLLELATGFCPAPGRQRAFPASL
jgi:hypothetical protein